MTLADAAIAEFLSRDPDRIARVLDQVTQAPDPEIDARLVDALSDIEASFRGVDIDPQVRRALAKYFWHLEKSRSRASPGAKAGACTCTAYSGNPSRYGATLRKVSEEVFAGHSEMVFQCGTCGGSASVTEDVGYHFPQYSWR